MTAEQRFNIHHFDNGITLLAEEMSSVSSAAFSILVPVGAVSDPEGQEGSSALLSEMFNKGAGPWDTVALSEEFERYGIQRSHSAGIEVSAFSGAMLGENLSKALELYSTVLLEPRFPDDELESVRQLALQDLMALEDEPSGKTMNELARVFYPAPFGRSPLGTVEGVRAITPDSLRNLYATRVLAGGSIIAVAGAFDWDEVREMVEKCFGSWSGKAERLKVGEFSKEDVVHHLQRDTSQLQIAMASASVGIENTDYYTAKVAVSVLSGGMSGRLFIEVREKRGLVYRVSASHSGARDRAAVFASAGTTPENANETLAVMLQELRRLKDGVNDEELSRAKADLKSRVIMQSELSSVRASGLVNDWFNLRRLRTLNEIKTGIDSVTSEDISRYAEEYSFSPLTLVTLGPCALELPK